MGNVMLLLLNLPLVGLFARVATIPARWLMPVVLLLCAVAAYADHNNPFDVWVLVGAGLLGYAMRGLGYDPARSFSGSCSDRCWSARSCRRSPSPGAT